MEENDDNTAINKDNATNFLEALSVMNMFNKDEKPVFDAAFPTIKINLSLKIQENSELSRSDILSEQQELGDMKQDYYAREVSKKILNIFDQYVRKEQYNNIEDTNPLLKIDPASGVLSDKAKQEAISFDLSH